MMKICMKKNSAYSLMGVAGCGFRQLTLRFMHDDSRDIYVVTLRFWEKETDRNGIGSIRNGKHIYRENEEQQFNLFDDILRRNYT